MAAVSEKQKILQQQREEIEELERNSDREVSFDQKLWRIILAPETLHLGRGIERALHFR